MRRGSRRNGCDLFARDDTLGCQEVYDAAAGVLERSLQWVDHGYKCTLRSILLVRNGHIASSPVRVSNRGDSGWEAMAPF